MVPAGSVTENEQGKVQRKEKILTAIGDVIIVHAEVEWIVTAAPLASIAAIAEKRSTWRVSLA